MPISGYFDKNRRELRMPKNGGTDPDTGAKYEGDVLEGKLSVEEALRRIALKAARNAARVPRATGALDPVLRSHLRLDEP
jgi:hypothetical protein